MIYTFQMDIQNDIAYFITAEQNLLFQWNLVSGEIEFLAELPDGSLKGSRAGYECMYYNNKIYCFPNRAKEGVWVYDMIGKTFQQIVIQNHSKCNLRVESYWIEEDILIMIAGQIGRIIEIDLQKDQIIKEYQISEEPLGYSVKIDDIIYSVADRGSTIYITDAKKKKTQKRILNIGNTDLTSIHYDGNVFWLTGRKQEIYIWNKEEDTICVLDQFPRDIRFYNFYENHGELICPNWKNDKNRPFISRSCYAGGCNWFISTHSDDIIYVGEDYKIKLLHNDREQESELDPNRAIYKQIYYMLYVRQKRYIGVFSIKYGQIFEIDTWNKEIIYKSDSLSGETLSEIGKVYKKNNEILYEQDFLYREIFKERISGTVDVDVVEFKEVGNEIHKAVLYK